MLAKQVNLSDGYINLKQLSMDDSFALHLMLSDEELTKKAGLLQHSHISETVTFINEGNKYVSSHQQYLYGIFYKKTLVGIINLFNYDSGDKSGEYGYFIYREFQKKGYMQRAIILLTNYLIENNIVSKIYVYIDATNIASINLIEKLGFLKIGKSIEEDLNDKSYLMYRYMCNFTI